METGSEASRIVSIGTAVPDFSSKQDTILSFMQEAYQEPLAYRKLNALFYHSGISTRYSVIPDFTNANNGGFFSTVNELPMVMERTDLFKKHALPLARRAIEKAFTNISTSIDKFGVTHLIAVTCTGLYSPGLDSELIEELQLPPDIFRTSLNFLGCNAAFPAIKLADSIIKSDPKAHVLVVCVELCTIHFQPKNNSDNLLANTIFGDGAAAVIITSEALAAKKNLKGFSCTGFYPLLLNKGKDLMGWNITPVNFEMILSSTIPDFLGGALELLMIKVSEKLNLDQEEIDNWAVHPGGKKILDAVQRGLHLKDNALEHSYEVLRNYGNMSSPTILFVLCEIFKRNPKHGETILAMGFGPGISIETASFVCHDFL